jgi:hypothetical protein
VFNEDHNALQLLLTFLWELVSVPDSLELVLLVASHALTSDVTCASLLLYFIVSAGAAIASFT